MSTAMSTATAPAPRKKQRGRETAADMIRSLGIILLIVIPVWFLAQPDKGDAKTLRVVDPTADVREFSAAAPGVPVPGSLPAGWRATSSTPEPGTLRIGWVTPEGQYAEYAASTAGPAYLPGITGSAGQVGTFDVRGVAWRQLRDGDGHTSLVREVGGGVVVVGGVRETATLGELAVLAGALR